MSVWLDFNDAIDNIQEVILGVISAPQFFLWYIWLLFVDVMCLATDLSYLN